MLQSEITNNIGEASQVGSTNLASSCACRRKMVYGLWPSHNDVIQTWLDPYGWPSSKMCISPKCRPWPWHIWKSSGTLFHSGTQRGNLTWLGDVPAMFKVTRGDTRWHVFSHPRRRSHFCYHATWVLHGWGGVGQSRLCLLAHIR